jgi:hypothetical protein
MSISSYLSWFNRTNSMEQSSWWEENSRLSDNSRDFYGTLNFMTVLTRGSYWFLFWAQRIQFMPSYTMFYDHCNVISLN